MWPTVFEADGSLAAGTMITTRRRYMQSIMRARRVHEVSAWSKMVSERCGGRRERGLLCNVIMSVSINYNSVFVC